MEASRRFLPKPFSCLEFLLDRRPEAVSKTELLTHLWPETFVSDGSLHNLVAEVRAALGDDPKVARYIRTIPRYGYAFHGDARPAPAVDVEVSELGRSGPRLVSKRREWLLAEGLNLVGRDSDCTVLHRFHHRLASSCSHRRDARRGNRSRIWGVKMERTSMGSPSSCPSRSRTAGRFGIGSVKMTYRILGALASTVAQPRL